jgi:GT2 family glycosyltransferase
MRIAIYTLTRDRLEYTQVCFERLRLCAGADFDHYVVDNGSTDGTRLWLCDEYRPKRLILNPSNAGISVASNAALAAITEHGEYDLIVKMDNDCAVQTPGILAAVTEIYRDPKAVLYVLSPRVVGINRQPSRAWDTELAGHRIGVTAIIGGLFHIAPAALYQRYRYPVDLPLAKGQDDDFCRWVRDANQDAEVGYIEDLVVEHYETTDGQALRFPEYFRRKWREEKTKP